MRTGEVAKLSKSLYRGESGDFGLAQKLLRPIGALEEIWARRRRQNYANLCKRNESGGSGVA